MVWVVHRSINNWDNRVSNHSGKKHTHEETSHVENVLNRRPLGGVSITKEEEATDTAAPRTKHSDSEIRNLAQVKF